MTDRIYIAFCLIAALFFTAVTIPAFAWEGGGGSFGGTGSGGSWGNSDGFGGNGGSSNNGGISATCAAESEKACKSNTGMPFIRNYVTPTGVVMMECGLNGYVSGYKAPCPPVKCRSGRSNCWPQPMTAAHPTAGPPPERSPVHRIHRRFRLA